MHALGSCGGNELDQRRLLCVVDICKGSRQAVADCTGSAIQVSQSDFVAIDHMQDS